MSKYFEIGVRYNKTTESGQVSKVTELYLVEAMTFTEAEGRIVEEMVPFISGEFEVATMKRSAVSEIVTEGSDVISCTVAEEHRITEINRHATPHADKWYRVKLQFIILDGKTGKERRNPYVLLCCADSVEAAHDVITSHMKGLVGDYEIVNIDETKLLDVFFHESDNTCGKEATDDA